MKNFSKIIVVLFAFLFISNVANAQYVYGPRDTVETSITQALDQIVEHANSQSKNGEALLWIGASSQVVGLCTMYIPYFSKKTNMTGYEKYDTAFYITGATFIAVGTVLDIIGIHKMIDGALDRRGVRISATAAGFTVDF